MDDLSPNTSITYARIIRRTGLNVPSSPDKVAAYIDKLVSAGRRKQTINQHLAALARQHHILGATFDTRHPLIAAARARAKIDPKRRPPPVQSLDGDECHFLPVQNARDQMLVFLRSKCGLTMEAIVALDWKCQGQGVGVMRVVRDHVRLDICSVSGHISDPSFVSWARTWADLADLRPGEPLFRQVRSNGSVMKTRLTAHGFRWMLRNRKRRHED